MNPAPTPPAARFRPAPGFTLLEVAVAALILALALIPLFHYSSNTAVENARTDRIQDADTLLESIREELATKPFAEFPKAADQAGGQPPYPLTPEVFFPVSLAKLERLNRSVGGFSVVGTWTFVLRKKKGTVPEEVLDKSMVNISVTALWQGGKMEVSRTRALFLTR